MCVLGIGPVVVIGRLGLDPGMSSEGRRRTGTLVHVLDPPVVFESTSSRLSSSSSVHVFLAVEAGLIAWPAQCEARYEPWLIGANFVGLHFALVSRPVVTSKTQGPFPR